MAVTTTTTVMRQTLYSLGLRLPKLLASEVRKWFCNSGISHAVLCFTTLGTLVTTSFQSPPDFFPTGAKHLKRLLRTLAQVDLSEKWGAIPKCLWLTMLLPNKGAINVDHLLPFFRQGQLTP